MWVIFISASLLVYIYCAVYIIVFSDFEIFDDRRSCSNSIASIGGSLPFTHSIRTAVGADCYDRLY